MRTWEENDTDCSDEIPCRYCSALVYWGPHYDAAGNFDRKLFTAATRRLHDCRARPNADDFEVIPDGR